MNPLNPNRIVSLMACMMNYLNASLYEGQFTYNHEQARGRLNEICDSVSKTPLMAPSVSDSEAFYRNVRCLRRVTDTYDPDYASYMGELHRYIVAAKRAEEAANQIS